MERILQNGKVYYEYHTEKEFEQTMIQQVPYIFGSSSIYTDIKKRIGDSIITIPDGNLIGFSFEADPRLYIIENELSSHDPYKHIGSQLLKSAISYKSIGRKIKDFLLQWAFSLISQEEYFCIIVVTFKATFKDKTTGNTIILPEGILPFKGTMRERERAFIDYVLSQFPDDFEFVPPVEYYIER